VRSPSDPQSEIVWSEIKTKYETEIISIAQLCKLYGVTRYQINKHAKQAAWVMRSKPTNHKNTKKSFQSNASKAVRSGVPTTGTLREALEFITMELMDRIAKESAQTTANHDRDARTLSSLVRTYEKLKTIEAESAATAPTKELSDQKQSYEQADERRADIAQRLEKLIKGL